MPRKPRHYIAGMPCHVIQRGNNRQPCFFAEQDYLFYLLYLKDACQRYKVNLHAYVLMTNHVHMLMTPDTADGISRVMQSLGRRYVQYVNFEYNRCGTLWEGRHKASLVNAEEYLFKCYRYIEMNPVRANMVKHPLDYRWSSYRENAHGEGYRYVVPHNLYVELGSDCTGRQDAYRELFAIDLYESDIQSIRQAGRFSAPLGNDRFRGEIEQVLGVRPGQAKRGRPRIEDEVAVYSI